MVIVALVGIAAALFARLPDARKADGNRVIMVANETSDSPSSASASSEHTAGQSNNELDRSIELIRDRNGYFYADVQINGAPVHMVVDTGATVVALSRDDARMAGVATSIGMNDVVGQGADGDVKGEEVTLDRVALGDKTVERVPAIVLSSGSQSLLGQSFLSKFASVQIEGDRMLLR
jgi:aspartyl protease family protein